MNTYQITFKEYDGYASTYIAETSGKAKYKAYLEDDDGDGFLDFLQRIESVKCVHKFHVSDLFEEPLGDLNQFEWMQEKRGIPFAFIGMRVSVCGRMGIICGTNHCMNLDVCFHGEYWVSNCHPHHETVYYDNHGNVLASYEEKRSCLI